MYAAVPTVELAAVRAVTSASLGDAEVGELDGSVFQDHEVGGLEIAVDDALVVSVLQGGAQVDANVGDFLPWQAGAPAQDMVERFPFDEFPSK